RFLQSNEGLEHFIKPVFRDAWTLVFDRCNKEIRLGLQRNVSEAAITHGILDEVSHGAADLVRAATAWCQTLDLHFDRKIELDEVVADAFDQGGKIGAALFFAGTGARCR